MSEVEIVNKRSISLTELKEHLDKTKKKKKELNFRENKVVEYVTGFDILKSKDAKEMKKALEGLDISRLKERHMVKIMDLLQLDSDTLKTILTGENLTLKQDDLNKIIEIVKKHA